MANFINLRKLVGTMAIAMVTLSTGLVNQASAYEPHGGYHVPACQYKTIITFEYRTEKFIDWVIQVDHYGYERKVQVVKYRTIKVPVKKVVKICHEPQY